MDDDSDRIGSARGSLDASSFLGEMRVDARDTATSGAAANAGGSDDESAGFGDHHGSRARRRERIERG